MDCHVGRSGRLRQAGKQLANLVVRQHRVIARNQFDQPIDPVFVCIVFHATETFAVHEVGILRQAHDHERGLF